MTETPTRRQAMVRMAKLCGTMAVTASAYSLLAGRTPAEPKIENLKKPSNFLIPNRPDQVVIVNSPGPTNADLMVKQAIDRLGGMPRFISKGDVVAIKPNMSWDRPVALAANTNPEIVSAVIKLCLEAGAAKINLMDNAINDPRRVFANSGMEGVARSTGANLIYPAASHFKTMNIRGRRITEWEVFTPVLEADKLINIPVAKSHGLTTVTLGMKSWIGAVGGRRGALHQDIHQSIVDLAMFFQPTLVIIDATKVMLANGPSGGRPSDIVARNTIIAGTDQVAVDAAALPLFPVKPEEIGFLVLAQQQGLGRHDPGPDKIIRVQI